MRFLAGLAVLAGLVAAQPVDSLDCHLVGTLQLPGPFHTLVDGNYAYVSCGDSGLRIVDVSDKANPALVGSLTVGSITAYSSAKLGDYLYLIGGDIVIVNVSDPAAPESVGAFQATEGYEYHMAIVGDKGYVGCWSSNFAVIGLADPASPVVFGEVVTPYYTNWVTADGNDYAYTSLYDSGMCAIDVSDSSAPTVVGRYDTLEENQRCERITKSGDYIYLTEASAIVVLDVSTPATPAKVGFWDAPAYCYSASKVGNYFYTGCASTGLRILDVSDPTDPSVAGYYQETDDIKYVVRYGRYIYTNSSDSVFNIIEFDLDTTDYNEVFVDTLFVSPTGTGDTFATIQAAVDSALPGYLVKVLAGTYNEQVTFPRSGVADSAITVRGDTNAAGELVSILDGTTPVDTPWTAAPEVGEGVYKKTGFAAKLMLWNSNQIIRINPDAMAGESTDHCDAGFNILDYDSTQDWNPYVPDITTRFWTDVQTIYGVLNADTTYIRHVDRNWTPDTCDLRATEDSASAFTLDGDDYIKIDWLKIQGYSTAITVNNSDNNVISHCLLRNGDVRAYITGGSANNTILANEFEVGYGDYALMGEWGDGQPDYGTKARRAASYALGKYVEGIDEASTNYSVQLYSAGTGNVIDSNNIHDGNIGVWGYISPQTTIRNNTISYHASVGYYQDILMSSQQVYNNDMDHNNITFRIAGPGAWDDTISGWFYNNRCYNDTNAGMWIKWFGHGYDKEQTPNFWFYHNSVAGFEEVVNPDTVNSYKSKMVNNIFSTWYTCAHSTASNDSQTDIYAALDYNFLGGLYKGTRYQAWMFTDRNNQWADDTILGDVTHQVWPLGAEPDWAVPDSSTADSAALDVFTDSFTIRGVTYGPLPGSAGYHSALGAWGAGDTTTPPAPTYGSVSATSTPYGASIWFDGVDTDSVTPCVTDSVTPGDVIVKLTLSGYVSYTDTVTVVAGDTATVNVALTPNVYTIRGNPTMLMMQ